MNQTAVRGESVKDTEAVVMDGFLRSDGGRGVEERLHLLGGQTEILTNGCNGNGKFHPWLLYLVRQLL